MTVQKSEAPKLSESDIAEIDADLFSKTNTALLEEAKKASKTLQNLENERLSSTFSEKSAPPSHEELKAKYIAFKANDIRLERSDERREYSTLQAH